MRRTAIGLSLIAMLAAAPIGTAAGALVGELATGQPMHGAAIGAAVGATSGWLYNRHEQRQSY